MKISGFQKNSLIDYPGQIASVLFVPFCNMDCYFCHNRHLLYGTPELIDQKEIFRFLESRKKFIDAVVMTGGEPTLYPDLEQFIRRIKELGYLIKLDTNGFEPDIIKDLLEKELLSYLAVDFKAPYDKYGLISTKKNDIERFKKTVRLLLSSDIDYEFRTTYLPELAKEDILQIAEEIKGAKNYYIQQFRPLSNHTGVIDMRAVKKPHLREYVMDTVQSVKNILKTTNVSVRGVK